MGNRVIEKDQFGRYRVDLFQLPRWARLVLAVAIVTLVVVLARTLDPHPHRPSWFPGAIRIGGYVYLGLSVFAFAALWIRRRRRRRAEEQA